MFKRKVKLKKKTKKQKQKKRKKIQYQSNHVHLQRSTHTNTHTQLNSILFGIRSLTPLASLGPQCCPIAVIHAGMTLISSPFPAHLLLPIARYITMSFLQYFLNPIPCSFIRMMMSVVSVFLHIISLVLNPPAGWQIGQEYIGYYSCCMCSKNNKRRQGGTKCRWEGEKEAGAKRKWEEEKEWWYSNCNLKKGYSICIYTNKKHTYKIHTHIIEAKSARISQILNDNPHTQIQLIITIKLKQKRILWQKSRIK